MSPSDFSGESVWNVQEMEHIYSAKSLNRLNRGIRENTETKKHTRKCLLFFKARCNQPHLLFSFSRGAATSVISCSHPPASSFLSHWLAQLGPVIPTAHSPSRPSAHSSSPGRSLSKSPSWDHHTPGWPHRETRKPTNFKAHWLETHFLLNLPKLSKDGDIGLHCNMLLEPCGPLLTWEYRKTDTRVADRSMPPQIHPHSNPRNLCIPGKGS